MQSLYYNFIYFIRNSIRVNSIEIYAYFHTIRVQVSEFKHIIYKILITVKRCIF